MDFIIQVCQAMLMVAGATLAVCFAVIVASLTVVALSAAFEKEKKKTKKAKPSNVRYIKDTTSKRSKK